MKWIVISSLFMLLSISSFSQANGGNETERLMTLNKQLEGTFQIQIIDSREQPTFPLSTLDEIRAKRDTGTVQYIWLKSNVRILILPKNEIADKNFKRLERVKYISSSEM
ncbi:MAG: hypothetical protein K0S33_4079 [Bacteroidetes bacterium]|jgi:hypothetical protein|nr:hypothetical protein [Bacteroidota bacterium]